LVDPSWITLPSPPSLLLPTFSFLCTLLRTIHWFIYRWLTLPAPFPLLLSLCSLLPSPFSLLLISPSSEHSAYMWEVMGAAQHELWGQSGRRGHSGDGSHYRQCQLCWMRCRSRWLGIIYRLGGHSFAAVSGV
jgi:hypothetical protein